MTRFAKTGRARLLAPILSLAVAGTLAMGLFMGLAGCGKQETANASRPPGAPQQRSAPAGLLRGPAEGLLPGGRAWRWKWRGSTPAGRTR